MRVILVHHTGVSEVSIHALRFQRAMPMRRTSAALAGAVSIHALRFQRAMRHHGLRGRIAAWFQSTPSVSRGRCVACVLST